MIYIDKRIGSNDLQKYIKGSMLVAMDYGDVAFTGNGPEGVVSIGWERKVITDLIGSIQSGRLVGHQLPGMMEKYDVCYLIVEGVFRADYKSGELLIARGKNWYSFNTGKRRWTMEGVCSFLTTLETFAGIKVRITPSAKATATMIEMTHHWWQKEWSEHHGHLSMHKGASFKDHKKTLSFLPEALEKPSVLRRIAAELPGVGVGRSKDIANHFGTLKAMFEASVKDWQTIPGIGKVTANLAWEELHK